MPSGVSVFIHSLRFGFATNSSSDHSLIFLPGAEEDLFSVRGGVYDTREPFVLTRREMKLPYLQAQLQEAGLLDEELRAEFEFGQVPAFIDDMAASGLSAWEGLPKKLAVEVGRWLLHDGVAVLCGGENAGAHPLADHRHAIDPSGFQSWKVRRDPLGFWSMLSRWGGTRMRLSFSRASHPHVLPFRSTWPELVDLKITDRCSSGCAFCYQGSTPVGRHASFETVEKILDQLAQCQVLEVVLGGGEPTEHPDFARILQGIVQRGMFAAFTTRNPFALEQCRIEPPLRNSVHWAYSPTDLSDLERLLAHRAFPDPAVHVVMGTKLSRPHELLEVARRCAKGYRRLVLLGFKRTGRGKDFPPVDYRHWMDTISASGLSSVAIDSALAAEFEFELERRGVPSWLYEVEDGRYSMYIDAVRGLCGPSSYCHEDKMIAMPSGPEGVGEAFEHINQMLEAERLHRALQLEQVSAIARNDHLRQVLLDAALEGRCEACGAEGTMPVLQGLARPALLCPKCSPARPAAAN